MGHENSNLRLYWHNGTHVQFLHHRAPYTRWCPKHSGLVPPSAAVVVAQRICPNRPKLRIPGSTATLCGDCVKTCEDVAPKFGEKRPGCFTMTTPRLTLPSSPTSFWRKTKWLSSPTHRNSLIWHPVTPSYFQK
jgi:hypothetical protein